MQRYRRGRPNAGLHLRLAADDATARGVSDADRALGTIVDFISHTPHWSSTAVFVVPERPSNRPPTTSTRCAATRWSFRRWRGAASSAEDHLSVASVVKTEEEIFGLPPLSLNDLLGLRYGAVSSPGVPVPQAYQAPMSAARQDRLRPAPRGECRRARCAARCWSSPMRAIEQARPLPGEPGAIYARASSSTTSSLDAGVLRRRDDRRSNRTATMPTRCSAGDAAVRAARRRRADAPDARCRAAPRPTACSPSSRASTFRSPGTSQGPGCSTAAT